MSTEMINTLTQGEVERAYYCYRGICDIYEEVYGSPRTCVTYREYVIADKTAMLLWSKMKAIGIV